MNRSRPRSMNFMSTLSEGGKPRAQEPSGALPRYRKLSERIGWDAGPNDAGTVPGGGARSDIPSAKNALAVCWVSLGWYFMPGKAHSGKTSIGGLANLLPRGPRTETVRRTTKAVMR